MKYTYTPNVFNAWYKMQAFRYLFIGGILWPLDPFNYAHHFSCWYMLPHSRLQPFSTNINWWWWPLLRVEEEEGSHGDPHYKFYMCVLGLQYFEQRHLIFVPVLRGCCWYYTDRLQQQPDLSRFCHVQIQICTNYWNQINIQCYFLLQQN